MDTVEVDLVTFCAGPALRPLPPGYTFIWPANDWMDMSMKTYLDVLNGVDVTALESIHGWHDQLSCARHVMLCFHEHCQRDAYRVSILFSHRFPNDGDHAIGTRVASFLGIMRPWDDNERFVRWKST